MAEHVKQDEVVEIVDCAKPKGVGESLECVNEVYAKTGKNPPDHDIYHVVDPKSCYITQTACRNADVGCDKKVVTKTPGREP